MAFAILFQDPFLSALVTQGCSAAREHYLSCKVWDLEQDQNNQISCCVKTHRLICQVFAQRTDQLHGQGWANRSSHVLSSRKTWSATVSHIKLASLVVPWIMWSFIKFSIGNHVILLNVNHMDTILVVIKLIPQNSWSPLRARCSRCKSLLGRKVLARNPGSLSSDTWYIGILILNMCLCPIWVLSNESGSQSHKTANGWHWLNWT